MALRLKGSTGKERDAANAYRPKLYLGMDRDIREQYERTVRTMDRRARLCTTVRSAFDGALNPLESSTRGDYRDRISPAAASFE